MEVLSSRVLLGLAVYREFGPREHRGVVYFLGNGLLEVSDQAQQPPVGLEMWLQVRNVAVSTSGWPAPVSRSPDRRNGSRGDWSRCGSRTPTAVRIAVVEVPEDHPLRDQR
jgi:hypothetical protein